jgi:hypothetical protein
MMMESGGGGGGEVGSVSDFLWLPLTQCLTSLTGLTDFVFIDLFIFGLL